MSSASKITVILACGGTIGIIFYVHFKQWYDKKKLHEGVLKDIERQQRKTENLFLLQQQIELKKILQKQERQDEAVAIQLLKNSQSEN